MKLSDLALAQILARPGYHVRVRARASNEKAEPTIVGVAKDVAPKVKRTPYPILDLCRAARLPEPVPEYAFHPGRRWRFDWCWPLHRIALEIEGGIWTQGRHTRGSGALADLEKYSEAAILGWRVLYATPDCVSNGTALDRLTRAFKASA